MASPHVAGAAALLAIHSNPASAEDVEAIRDAVVEAGNFGYEDTSGDGVQEPLLDVGNEEVFSVSGPSQVPVSRLEAEEYPATLSGEQDPEGPLEMDIEGSFVIACDTGAFGSALSEATSDLSVEAEYGSCHEGDSEVSVAMNSCELALEVEVGTAPYGGAAAVACSEEGDAIEVTHPECDIEISPQALSGTVSYENQGAGSERSVAVSIDAEEVHYRFVEGLCTFLGENHYGTLSNQLTLWALG